MAAESNNGLFRANPNAASPNNLRLVDPTTPGAPAQDNGTVAIESNATVFNGVQYIGKDAVSRYIPFFDYQYPDGTNEPKPVFISDGYAGLQAAIRAVVEMEEVDPIVTVGDVEGDWAVRHVGSGTIDYIVTSGGAVQLNRTAL